MGRSSSCPSEKTMPTMRVSYFPDVRSRVGTVPVKKSSGLVPPWFWADHVNTVLQISVLMV